MALDPQIAPIVAAVQKAAEAGPPISEQTVEERREAYQALSSLPGDGPQLDEVTDISIPGPDGNLAARVYRNSGATGIFVFYHGGGYTIGDLDSHDQVCRRLATQSHSTVVAIDYRLAPEHPFPAGVNDAWAALQWVDANRAELGGAGDAKIVVGGDSAGGNLSAVVALMARDAGLDLAAQLLVYPAVDVNDDSPSMTENAEGYVLTRQTMEWFNEQYAADAADWRASPILADSHEGLATALVITAQYDPLRDQGARYAQTLKDAGVDVTLSNYEGMAHIFFQLAPIVDAATKAIGEVADAAKKALA